MQELQLPELNVKENSLQKQTYISHSIETGKPNGGLIPTDFEGLWRFSRILAASGLMPTGLQKQESIFVAIQMGLEIGLSPMQAVQNVAVINGKPTLWGDAVLALVLKSNQVKNFSEYFEGIFPNDDYTAICEIERSGFRTVFKRTFSVHDAKIAGLWPTQSSSKTHSPWTKYPKRMLQMRARSWTLRDGFSDYLKGFGVAEEVRDYVNVSTSKQRKDDPPKQKTFIEACKEKILVSTEELIGTPTREILDNVSEYIAIMAIESNVDTETYKESIMEYDDFEDFWEDFILWNKTKKQK